MITIKAQKLSSFKDKTIGLMFAKRSKTVCIETNFGIHTFFVRFPIDVVLLNKENKVIKIKQNLKPNRIFMWSKLQTKIIELPVGEIENKKIKAGEIIKFE